MGRGKNETQTNIATATRASMLLSPTETFSFADLEAILNIAYPEKTLPGRPQRFDPYRDIELNALTFLHNTWQEERDPDIAALLTAEWQKTINTYSSGEKYDISNCWGDPSSLLDEARKRIIEEQKDAFQEASAEELEALRYYRGPGFRPINTALRLGQPLSYDEQQIVDNLDRLFQRLPRLSMPLLVSRGLDRAEAHKYGSSMEELNEKYLSQTIVTEDAYSSTGAKLVHIKPMRPESINLLIALPKGSHALCMQGAWDYDPDLEVVLPRQAKLDIKQVITHPDGALGVYAHLVS